MDTPQVGGAIAIAAGQRGANGPNATENTPLLAGSVRVAVTFPVAVSHR
jgi:hypothetical protein